MLNHLMRFVIVGGSATLLQYLLLVLFVELHLLTPVLASPLAFGLSAIANYLLNYHFTFASRAAHTSTLPKFIAVASLGLIINSVSFAIFLSLVPHYLAAQIIATVLTLGVNFLLHKFWIYRS